MASMDWLAGLGAQDASMEAMMAKRNLLKTAAPLMEVARIQETQRSNQADEQQRTLDRSENAAYRTAVQEATQQQREQMIKERETDNVRARRGLILGKLQDGDRVRDPEVLDAVRTTVGADQLTPADDTPDDPEDFIYRKLAWDKKQLEEQAKQDADAAREKRAKDAEKRDQARLGMAQKDADLRQKREDRIAKDSEAKKKALEGKIAALPIALRPAVKARAEEIMQENSSIWDFIPGRDESMNQVDAWTMAEAEVRKKAQETGAMPVTGPVTVPQAPGAVPPPAGGGDYLSPEEVKAKFPNLPPGAKVRRIG